MAQTDTAAALFYGSGLDLTLAVFLGLCLGSFATALVYRLPRGISILTRHRSACPACGKDLSAGDLVPLFSWLFLRGKCRRCAAPIGVRYPLIELATLAVTLALYAAFGFTPAGVASFLLAPVLVSMVAIDFEYKIIPDSLTLTLALTAVLVFFLVALDMPDPPGFLVEEGLPLLLAGFFYGLGAWGLRAAGTLVLRREPLGLGDVKLFAALGLWLGPDYEALAFLLICAGGSGIVLALLWRRLRGEAEFPFGPAIILGFLAVLLLRDGLFAKGVF